MTKNLSFLKRYILVSFLSFCSASFIACSDDDGDKKEPTGAALPVELNFMDENFPIQENKGYQPFEYKSVSCWNVPIGTDGNGMYSPVVNLTTENTEPLLISKYVPSEDPSYIWNWTGGVGLLSGRSALVLDLTKFIGIKKISIRGLDNNSFIQAKVFNKTNMVAETNKVVGNSSAYVDLSLDVTGKKVTQLYIVGLESIIKRIYIE